jgi:hypothetical protein
MKKYALVVVAITLVSCQPIATTNQSQQTKLDQDEYQEEAYQIGLQEEAYNKQNKSC